MCDFIYKSRDFHERNEEWNQSLACYHIHPSCGEGTAANRLMRREMETLPSIAVYDIMETAANRNVSNDQIKEEIICHHRKKKHLYSKRFKN